MSRPMATVSTVEELDALPEHTVIRDRHGIDLFALPDRWWQMAPERSEMSTDLVGEQRGPFEVLAVPVGRLAEAWEEGAQAGWASSCEGENGEYTYEFGTHDGKALFRDVVPECPNPYRDDTGEVDV